MGQIGFIGWTQTQHVYEIGQSCQLKHDMNSLNLNI